MSLMTPLNRVLGLGTGEGAAEHWWVQRLTAVALIPLGLWFAYELDRRLAVSAALPGAPRITVNGWEPGLVPGSGLAREYPAAMRLVWHWLLPAIAAGVHPFVPGISTLSASGAALARMVTDPALEGVSGKYFPSTARWRESPSSQDSYDVARARELWEASVRMTALSPLEAALAPP